MPRPQLDLLAAVAGAATAAVCLIVSRLLVPLAGASLGLQSSLTAAGGAALACGLGLGRRWADRGVSVRRAGGLLAVAGMWTLGLPWLRSVLWRVAEPAGIPIATAAAAIFLVAPCGVCLGALVPLLARWQAPRSEARGRATLRTLAIAAAGALTAGLAAALFLVPHLGASRTALVCALLQLAAAALALAVSSRKAAVGTLVLAVVAAAALWKPAAEPRRADSTPKSGLSAPSHPE